jgi:ribosomal protein S13
MTTKNTSNFIHLILRPQCTATFSQITGIGKIKAKKVNSFLYNHPQQLVFKDFLALRSDERIKQVLKLPLDKRIRLNMSRHIRNKIMIFTYGSMRLFQSLSRGGRSKCNSKTTRHFNTYLSLGINPKFYQVMSYAYKRRELFANGRFKELQRYTLSIKESESKEQVTESKKSKKNVAKQQYFKHGK